MPELNRNSVAKTPVLVVGAGPTGLVLALWLKKMGVPFRIIDKSQAAGETSRALAIQARTLEFYRQLGIDEKIVASGITVRQLLMRRLGRVVAKARLGAMGQGISPFPYLLFLSQDVHEELLNAELAILGTKVERQTELLDFTQNDEEVLATLKGPGGVEKLRAEYLCGCDGAHSTVRHGLGLEFPGGTYSQVFYVADISAPDKLAEHSVQISLSRGSFCIVMPIQKRNSIRLTGLVPPESEKKEEISFADVAESVRRETGLHVKKVNWFSIYHVHHRVANRFHKGRAFLVGDAAHIHSPAGGQGMNTGIGDAVNLAWKLAEVYQGRASSTLLETFEPERMAFARLLVQTTDRAFRFVANRRFLGWIFRVYLLPGLFSSLVRVPFILRLMFRTISQVRVHYHESPLSEGQAGGVQAGDRLPFIESHRNYDLLRTLQWQIHVYGQAQDSLRSAGAAFSIPVHEFEWNKEAQDKGLLQEAIYLVRPDGHVALAVAKQDPQALKNYLAKWAIRGPKSF